jgi:hypothetical protein
VISLTRCGHCGAVCDETETLCSECGRPLHSPTAAPVRSTTPRICPYCRSNIGPSESTVECSACRLVYHSDCWQENGGCSTYGCKGKATAQQRKQPAPTPAAPAAPSRGAAPRRPAPPVGSPAGRGSIGRRVAIIVLILVVIAAIIAAVLVVMQSRDGETTGMTAAPETTVTASPHPSAQMTSFGRALGSPEVSNQYETTPPPIASTSSPTSTRTTSTSCES